MPLISRIMIRLSLLYLLAGTMIGALMLANKAIPFYPEIWSWLPVHIEMLIFGWILQFTLGTAYWILPRLLEGPPRGNENIAHMIPILLNAGILITILSHFNNLGTAGFAAARMAQLGAVVVFVALHWKRVSKMIHQH